MNHLEEGLLHAWLDAETTTEQDDRFQAHRESCEACAATCGRAS